ncbi:MAG TPA: hypothetical protein EYP90_08905, partial [Chromatiaceae bacterium]|nr:hypothetical protein [Chromatiaceae bacterium]
MIEYHKSSMTIQGYILTEIKAVYLASDTFDKVKQWYIDKFNHMLSEVYDYEESIDAGGLSGVTMDTVHIDFEK